MAVKIRLARRGRKKLALYDIVAADVKAPRDSRYIEKIGTYNPNTSPSSVHLNEDSALKWLLNGAQPTDTVRSLLSSKGVLLRKRLQIGVKKGSTTQEEADKRWEAWKREKEAKVAEKIAEKAKIVQGAAKTKAKKETAKLEKTSVDKSTQPTEIAEKATNTKTQNKAKTQEVTSQDAPKTKSEEAAKLEKTGVDKSAQPTEIAEKATNTKIQHKAKTQEVTSQDAPKTKHKEEAKEVSSTTHKTTQDVPEASDKESRKEIQKVEKDKVEKNSTIK